MRKLRDDDRGITLVELIVSIAILAIIVLPFLNSFVTAARTNAKSRNELNATHLAENIMEGIEKNSMKSLAYQFNYPAEGFDIADGFDMSGNGSNSQELLLDTDAGGKSVYSSAVKLENVGGGIADAEKDSHITSSIHKKDTTATINDTNKWNFVENDSTHKYYFYMTNVKSGTKNYNALVTMDARSDEAKESGKTDGKRTEYNKDAVADMSAMDFDHDAIATDKTLFESLKNDLKNDNLVTDSFSEDDVKKRTITIDIENTTSTKVSVSYSYKIKGKDGNEITFPDVNSAKKANYTSIVFDNTTDTVNHDLRNIYLFYNPWYYTATESSASTTARDNIIINNSNNVECTVSLVKQKKDKISNLSVLEGKYNVIVNLVEPDNKSGSSKACVTIASNFETNLGSPNTSMSHKQALYQYNGDSTQAQIERIQTRNLTKDTVSDRIYDVRVDIYESKVDISKLSTEKPVVSLTGSMVD
ncbi:type IV pilus modification PilV family protein [Agathobacter sp.]